MTNDSLKRFHGSLFSEGPWNAYHHSECKLCKTRNSTGNKRHWARGLCRSCYRRLSLSHRNYNDNWNLKNSQHHDAFKVRKLKAYKTIEIDADSVFDGVGSLLERFGFRCAYCRCLLQDYDPRAKDAFQLEFYGLPNGRVILVTICRSCNCSKKNLNTEEELASWATRRNIQYPFNLLPDSSTEGIE